MTNMIKHRKIVAILDTMWGDRNARAPRSFVINPYNASGKRLYKLVGAHSENLLVTNCCRQMVTDATKHGKPDPAWLAENLKRLDPEVILVCGKVAEKTFKQACPMIWDGNGIEIFMPHPAARRWTKELIQQKTKEIATALGRKNKENKMGFLSSTVSDKDVKYAFAKADPEQITQEILDSMGSDNGCFFQPCNTHRDALVGAVTKLQKRGVKFTPNAIDTLAYGEQRDQDRLVKKYGKQGKVLHKTLNVIFDGCKKCSSKKGF